MCTSLYRSQNSTMSTDKQRPWRPWESPNYKERSHITPKSTFKKSPVSCNYGNCHATFKRESEQKRHCKSKHLQKREICKVCQKIFTRKDNLTRHIKLTHSQDDRPVCKFCRKSLSRKDAVQRHESTCSKNPTKGTKQIAKIQEEINLNITHRERLLRKFQKSQLSSSTNPKVEKNE